MDRNDGSKPRFSHQSARGPRQKKGPAPAVGIYDRPRRWPRAVVMLVLLIAIFVVLMLFYPRATPAAPFYSTALSLTVANPATEIALLRFFPSRCLTRVFG